MSAPAGSPHPAAGARMPPKLGGAASGLMPPQQNGPAQSQMQVPSGYGLPHQNYMAPSGHYSQGPGKMSSLPLDNQCDNYYSRPYTVPSQSVGTPSSANQPGTQQMYGRGPPAPHMGGSTPGSFQGAPASASHSYTSASQPYSSFGNRYSSPATYSANSSAASQGYPSTCSHYPISTVSNVVYPNVSYPSLSASEPYGQMYTSQSAPPSRPVKESYSGPSTAITYPSRPPLSQQQQQPQSHSGYSSLPWPAPGLPPAQDSLIRNQMGSLATANSHPTNSENVHLPKPSSVVSTVLQGPSSTRMPPAPSHPVGPMPLAPPPPEQMQTKVRFPVPSLAGCGKWRLNRDPGLWGTCIGRMRERPPEKFANKGVKRLRLEPTEKPKVWPLKPVERSPRRRPPAQTSRRATPPTWGQIKRLMQMSEEGARGLGLGNNPAAIFLMCLVIISIQSGVEHYSEPPLD